MVAEKDSNVAVLLVSLTESLMELMLGCSFFDSLDFELEN